MAEKLKSSGIDKHPIAMKSSDWSWYLMALSMGDPMFDNDFKPIFANKGSKSRVAMKMLLEFFSEELISPEIVAGTVNQHSIFWSGTGTFHQGWQGSIRIGNNAKKSKQAPHVAYMVLPGAKPRDISNSSGSVKDTTRSDLAVTIQNSEFSINLE